MAGGAAAFAAVLFSMISIRLMMVVEGTQVIVAGRIGRQLQPDRFTAFAIGTHKFLVIKLSIAFFSRISNMLFWAEGMYQERAVHGAAVSMLNSIMISSRVKVAAKHTRHAARRVRSGASSTAVYCGKNLKSSVRRRRASIAKGNHSLPQSAD